MWFNVPPVINIFHGFMSVYFFCQQVNGPVSPPINVRSVKELVLGVIEMQIKKNPCGPVNTGVNVVTSEGAPTISSILKTDHRTDMLRPSSGITLISYIILIFKNL